MWQQRWYLTLVLIFGVGVPIATSGLLLGDWMGGLVFAFGLRSVIVFHASPHPYFVRLLAQNHSSPFHALIL